MTNTSLLLPSPSNKSNPGLSLPGAKALCYRMEDSICYPQPHLSRVTIVSELFWKASESIWKSILAIRWPLTLIGPLPSLSPHSWTLSTNQLPKQRLLGPRAESWGGNALSRMYPAFCNPKEGRFCYFHSDRVTETAVILIGTWDKSATPELTMRPVNSHKSKDPALKIFRAGQSPLPC